MLTSNSEKVAILITWLDVFKLCIPLFSSLVIIWIRVWFLHMRELFYKQEALWSALGKNLEKVPKILKDLDSSIPDFESQKVRIVDIQPCPFATSIVRHLAELDPKNSSIYNEYADWSDMIEKGNVMRQDLLKLLFSSQQDQVGPILAALKSQVSSLKKFVLHQAQAEIEVLKLLAERSRKRDQKVVGQHQKTIDSFLREISQPD